MKHVKKTKHTSAPAEPSWAEATIQTMTREIKQRRTVLAWIKKYQARFDKLATPCTFFGGQIDFDNLTHEPPPSCVVVEERVLVPARIETVRRLVCPKL